MSVESKEDNVNATLSFIVNYINAYDYPPNMREIGNGIGVGSTNTVNNYLKELRKDGSIETGDNGESRAVRVVLSPSPIVFPEKYNSIEPQASEES